MTDAASPNRWSGGGRPSPSDYDRRWERLAAGGVDVHGEAGLVASYNPATVLDAGCGTGRVAIELARRGIDVVGVDLDPGMLAMARVKAPGLTWIAGDLATVALGRTFEVIVAAGNVMLFVAPGSEGDVLAALATHLAPGGRLVAGFSLTGDGLDTGRYDELAGAAGLAFEDRWSTWDRSPFHPGATYAVSVHRAPPHDRERPAAAVGSPGAPT